ncbi:EamA family transporter [Photobacterium kasasachensis]|uniref:EamA family transporter n=1 Tax=Photobacterium kasasachensis TaxID=2910240 RepID=UPI003D0A3640
MQYLKNILLTALAPIIWGSTYIVTTELLPEDQPFTAALIRAIPAGLILLLLFPARLGRENRLKMLILSVLNIGIFQGLLFVAAYRLPGGVAAVVGAMQPIIIMLIIWLVDQNKPRFTVLASGILAIAGMSAIFVNNSTSWDHIGLMAAFAGTVSMSLGTFLSKRWGSQLHIMSFTGWQLLLGGICLVPFAIAFDTLPSDITLNNFIGYFYLSSFGALLAYSLWFRGIKALPSTSVSSLGLLSPITALTLGWIILGEDLDIKQIAGVVTVLVSILFIVNQSNKAKKTPTHVLSSNS